MHIGKLVFVICVVLIKVNYLYELHERAKSKDKIVEPLKCLHIVEECKSARVGRVSPAGSRPHSDAYVNPR